MSVTYIHSGDMGDIIYALAAIKEKHLNQSGKPVLVLNYLNAYKIEPKPRFSENEFNVLVPLLHYAASDYCKISFEPFDPQKKYYKPTILDRFRIGNDLSNVSILENHRKIMGLTGEPTVQTWLRGRDEKKTAFGFGQTARYGNDGVRIGMVDTALAIAKEKGYACLFFGTEREYRLAYRKQDMEFVYTKDLMEAARELGHVEAFFGNQSVLAAMCMGLGIKTFLEVCLRCPNCSLTHLPHLTPLTKMADCEVMIQNKLLNVQNTLHDICETNLV